MDGLKQAGAAPEPEPFHFYPAPDDLKPYLNSLYIWRSREPQFRDELPAYSGQMLVFGEGSGSMEFDRNRRHQGEGAFFLAPLLRAHTITIDGPASLFGVSLNFRGWAAFTGLDVAERNDCFLEPGEFLEPDLVTQMQALPARWRAGEIDDAAMLEAMTRIVRQGLRPLSEKHIIVIDRTLDWLSSSFKPELEDLYAALPYSERQVQRLVARFFGQSPIRLIRRYRAVRAATLLSMPQLSPDLEAEIREAFYDQAHLIKEIRYFTGRTPRKLFPDGSALHDMLGPEGYGSVDLFGGSQDEQLGKRG